MAISEPYELDGVTVGNSELSLVSGTTTLQNVTDDGVYQFWVDASNMAKGDEFVFRVYEKVEATGGTKRVVFTAYLRNAQSELFVTPTLILMHSWDATLQKTAGTDRAFDASVRKVA